MEKMPYLLINDEFLITESIHFKIRDSFISFRGSLSTVNTVCREKKAAFLEQPIEGGGNRCICQRGGSTMQTGLYSWLAA